MRMDEGPGLLLERCRGGDQAAWGVLVREYGGLVFAVARRCGLAEDACEDVAQITFASLASHLGSLREPAALPGWLATTARREAIRRSKADGPRQGSLITIEPASDDRPPSIEDLEDHQRLRSALERLGDRCRKLLRALYFEASTPDYRGIADRLGMPVGSIGPTRQRCLAKLAELYGGMDREKP